VKRVVAVGRRAVRARVDLGAGRAEVSRRVLDALEDRDAAGARPAPPRGARLVALALRRARPAGVAPCPPVAVLVARDARRAP
jgi:hypothetical protein